jgi:hypothetical protein
MSLLQTVTSALLLHFSRLLPFSGGGRSSIFYTQTAKISRPEIIRCMQLTCIFAVTTVTNNNKTPLKAATAKDFRFVTAPRQYPSTVTLLLQTVTNCNKHCNKRCNIFIYCISISYSKCYSWHPKNLYLRISLSQNKFSYSTANFLA